ncbi:MAG: Gfo/Idh/MocA family oxidoreductase [Oscillospiraceae bacterium]|nr:Gfo/Idh/MocA family oxidoreductase [Oscillospiraceae bacterium]
MKILRTAVIGLGRTGWNRHVPNIVSHDGFELVAAMDTSPERMAEFETKYGLPVYDNITDMLKSEKPDLVIVASPTHFHKEHIITSMEFGADVFAEKPVAKDIDEVYEIRDAAKRMGRKIMVFQPHRANAVVNTLKKIFEENKIGKLHMIKRADTSYVRRNDWQALKKYGGGMLNNYGAHYIDQLRYLTGEDLRVLSCTCDRVATCGDAEDVVQIIMKSESGIALDVNISQAAAYPITSWMAFGEYGTVFAEEEFCEEFKVKYIVPEECPPIELQSTLAAKGRTYSSEPPLPWHEETVKVEPSAAIDFYVKCHEYFAEDKEPFVPFEQSVRLMEILDEGHKAAQL